jgi:hypothetical protein
MRHPQAVLISSGVALAGLLVAACGATHSAPPVATTSSVAHVSDAAAHASIAFVSPRAGRQLGPTVHVRVRRSETGRVRFVLDGHSRRVTDATTVVYRHLAPGAHHLRAELLAASGQGPVATAVIRFRVRRPPIVVAPPPAPPPMTATSPTPAPATATAPPPPAAPVPPQTQTTMSAPAPATGIPQNGGGDDDSDNHGAPSDGDGNI